MNLDPSQHRRSIRLHGYDYSLPGFYYVTICIENKEPSLARFSETELLLCAAGQMARRAWEMLPRRFPLVALDAFVVMPNHIHGLIQITDVGALLAAPGPNREARDVGALLAAPGGNRNAGPQRRPSLGEIIRVFKSTSAISINRLLNRSGRRLWQRNYYEHIVRDQDELAKIREYIAENPLWWVQDPENPEGWGSNAMEMPWEHPYRAQQAAPLRGNR